MEAGNYSTFKLIAARRLAIAAERSEAIEDATKRWSDEEASLRLACADLGHLYVPSSVSVRDPFCAVCAQPFPGEDVARAEQLRTHAAGELLNRLRAGAELLR